MLEISPSLIDSYRYWRATNFDDPEREAAALADLIASIKREPREPTEAMARGKAWHEALEVQPRACGPEIEVEGYIFRFDPEDVMAIRRQLPRSSHLEMWGRLELPEVDVVMNLRTDGIHGNRIDEHKTTGKIDVDRYIMTAQWRAYLLAFDCRYVVYHIVKLNHDRRENIWRVKEYLPFVQYAYPRMRADLAREAGDLAAFIRHNGLSHYREESAHAHNA